MFVELLHSTLLESGIFAPLDEFRLDFDLADLLFILFFDTLNCSRRILMASNDDKEEEEEDELSTSDSLTTSLSN